MKAKEKADELYIIFYMIIYTDQDQHDQTKRCCIRCVEQILLEIPEETLDIWKGETNFVDNERFSFWQDVKSELEALNK